MLGVIAESPERRRQSLSAVRIDPNSPPSPPGRSPRRRAAASFNKLLKKTAAPQRHLRGRAFLDAPAA